MDREAFCNKCDAIVTYHARLFAGSSLEVQGSNVFVHPENTCKGSGKVISALDFKTRPHR